MGSGSSSQGSQASGAGGPLELYWDHRSPPSRCVHMTLKALGEKFEVRHVDLFKGEGRSPDYLKVNPSGKVPAIKQGSFTLSESRAIACYLCNKFQSAKAKSLYPRDPMKRAEVDRMLYLSEDLQKLIIEMINLPAVIFQGGKPNMENVASAEKALMTVGEILGMRKFIAGDQLTIADFFCAMPFLLLEMTTKDDFPAQFFGKDRTSKVKNWLDSIKALPYFGEVNDKGHTELRRKYFDALDAL